MGRLTLVVALMLGSIGFSKAQSTVKQLIQVSGVVVSGDSLVPIPFASVIIKGSFRGTVTDYFGYYSLVVDKNDTLEFNSLGYTAAEYVMPDTLHDPRYSLIQVMNKDTIELPEVSIYAWPTYEQFRQAFKDLNQSDDASIRAMRNVSPEMMQAMAQNLPRDPQMRAQYNVQQMQSRLYSAGQAPTTGLLNPLAWAKFIKAWKNGDYSKDK